MVLLLKVLFRGYHKLFNELSDRRADGFLFMDSVLYPVAIMALYLYLIKKVLPEYMENRPPFKIEGFIKIFNLSQVLINAYISYHATLEVFKFNWRCQPIDYSPTRHNMFIIGVVYLYFLTKIMDLLDTIFFVLRKKITHVSFLHVYHHFGMVALVWIGMKFFGGGHSVFLGWANSIVHTVMYFYYLITIWRPELKKNIWWKKYITQMQLIQFAFLAICYGQILLQPDCGYPKIVSYFILPQSIFMMMLFGDFYIKAYIRPKNKPHKHTVK